MQVLSVASECVPLVKTGGLADVAGALPAALAPEGVHLRTLLPAYPGLADRLEGTAATELHLATGPARLLEGQAAGLDVILLDAPALFDRAHPYLGPGGRDWPDNHLRFGALAEAAARIAQGALPWRPDLIHAHDWQAGLVPAHRPGRPVVLTIHNIAFQGVFGAEAVGELGLDPALFTPSALEYHGFLGFLKAGIALADRITTVSPTYAAELMTPEFGMGLEGLLRHRAADLSGILNGIDTAIWDPAADPAIAAPYWAENPGGKSACAEALRAEFALAEGPLFGVISRLTGQKGLDLLPDALPAMLAAGGTLVLLGSGEPALEARLAQAAAAHPGRVAVRIGYDEPLAHRIQAGADALLVPSRFEPCGLTQLCALRYGTIPVVARTGGLADTVIDANPAALTAGVATGVQHAPGRTDALADAIVRTCALRASDHWPRMVANAMAQPVGWEVSARAYAALYRGLA